MTRKVVVMDYGIGNVFSICNALHHCGADVTLTSDSRSVREADRLILPGVGAFKDGMDNLKTRGLFEDIMVYKDRGRPFLGICLGMQMMLDVGEEFGTWEGLGLIPGRVAGIPGTGRDGTPHKIPHMGWNRIYPADGGENWPGKGIFSSLVPGNMVYFVHSFHAEPQDRTHVLAVSDYNGVEITAAVARDHIVGCQFHPEKSGKTGLKIFKRFMEL